MLRRQAVALVVVAFAVLFPLFVAQAQNNIVSSIPPDAKVGFGSRFSDSINVVCLSISRQLLAKPLLDLCNTADAAGALGGTNTSVGGSIGSIESRVGGLDPARTLVISRLQERTGTGTAASADMRSALRGFSFFVNGTYEAFDKHDTSFEPAYDRLTWGTNVGGDYSFDGKGLVGLAFNYSHANAYFDVGGGGFETDTYGVLLYGGVLPAKNAFVDAYAGYNYKDISTDRRINVLVGGTVPVTGQALGTTNGSEVKLGVNAGYDWVIQNFTVGPRLGVNYRDTGIDAFTERGGTGLEVRYTHTSEMSVTTVAGLFASMAFSAGFGVIVPQLNFEYVHEFSLDQKFRQFSFVGDTTGARFNFVNDPPDRDYFNLGAGVVFVLPQGIQPFVNYRELLGYNDRSAHTVTAGVRFSF